MKFERQSRSGAVATSISAQCSAKLKGSLMLFEIMNWVKERLKTIRKYRIDLRTMMLTEKQSKGQKRRLEEYEEVCKNIQIEDRKQKENENIQKIMYSGDPF